MPDDLDGGPLYIPPAVRQAGTLVDPSVPLLLATDELTALVVSEHVHPCVYVPEARSGDDLAQLEHDLVGVAWDGRRVVWLLSPESWTCGFLRQGVTSATGILEDSGAAVSAAWVPRGHGAAGWLRAVGGEGFAGLVDGAGRAPSWTISGGPE